MNQKWKSRREWMFLIFFAVLLYFAFKNFSEIPKYLFGILNLILPILIGCAIAFVLNGPMGALERWIFGNPAKRRLHVKPGVARSISLLLTLVLAIGILVGVLFLIIPEIVRTISSLIQQLPNFFRNFQATLNSIKEGSGFLSEALKNVDISLESIQDSLLSFLRSVSVSVVNQTLNFSLSIVSFLINLVFGICLAIYILSQKERLGRQTRSILYAYVSERRVDRLLGLAHLTSEMFSKFITGQLLEAFILGMTFLIVMSILGFPYAVLISVIIMVFALVPLFGAYIAAFIGALLVLIAAPSRVLWFIILFVLIQQLEGNFVYPKVVGKSVGLSSMWVLVAITLGGAIWGILGILISIPLISVLYTLLSSHVKRRLEERKVPCYKTDQSQL